MEAPHSPSERAPQQAQAQRTAVAVAVAPMGVLAGFTAVAGGFMEADTALVVFAACSAWVAYELYRYQRLIGEAGESD